MALKLLSLITLLVVTAHAIYVTPPDTILGDGSIATPPSTQLGESVTPPQSTFDINSSIEKEAVKYIILPNDSDLKYQIDAPAESENRVKFSMAEEYCKNLGDWRLPTGNEMQNLYNFYQADPSYYSFITKFKYVTTEYDDFHGRLYIDFSGSSTTTTLGQWNGTWYTFDASTNYLCVQDTTPNTTIDTFTVTVSSSDTTKGSVTKSNPNGEIPLDENITLSAIATDGYKFLKWSDANTQNPRVIQVKNDISLEALFEAKNCEDDSYGCPSCDIHEELQFNTDKSGYCLAKTYSLLVSYDTTQGNVQQDKNGSVFNYQTLIKLEAEALEGYKFISWSDEDASNPRTLLMESDTNLTATFIQMTCEADGYNCPVVNPIKPYFVPSADTATVPATINFYDTSESNETFTSWRWSIVNEDDIEIISAFKQDEENKDFEFKFVKEGTYTVTLEVSTDDGSSNSYSKKIALQESSEIGDVIILAGKGDDPEDNLYRSVYRLSTTAYKYFKLRGFSDSSIYFMYGKDSVDTDGDGFDDGIVDDNQPSATKFYKAITDLSTKTIEHTAAPLYIYMIDHGAKGSFLISQKTSDGIVYATKLAEALDTFQTATGRDVVLIMEACYSGSFKNQLLKKFADKRAVYFSSNENQLTYIGFDGSYAFSKFFFRNLLGGDDIHTSYLKTLESMQKQPHPYNTQLPVFNNTITTALKKNKLGGDFATATVFPTINIDANTTKVHDWKQASKLNLKTKVVAAAGVQSVWATVIPPNYEETNSDDYYTPDLSSYKVSMSKSVDKVDEYTLEYAPAIPINGDYSLSVYVQDKDNNIESQSISITAINADEANNTLVLKAGWNLVSLPVAITLDADDLNTYFSEDTLWTYSEVNTQAWSVYTYANNTPDGINTLTSITAGEGFWVKSSIDKEITFNADQTYDITASQNIESLNDGWHLLGTGVSKTTQELEQLNDNIYILWKYKDNTWMTSFNTTLPDSILKMDMIESGEGFWVLVK